MNLNDEFSYPARNSSGCRGQHFGNSVFVASAGSHAIVRHALNRANNGSWGGPGSDDGRFSSLYGVAVDTEGQAYVADFNNDRIQVFQLVRVVWTFQRKWGLQGAGDSRFAGTQLNGLPRWRSTVAAICISMIYITTVCRCSAAMGRS